MGAGPVGMRFQKHLIEWHLKTTIPTAIITYQPSRTCCGRQNGDGNRNEMRWAKQGNANSKANVKSARKILFPPGIYRKKGQSEKY